MTDETKRLTYEQANALLDECVAEKGSDFVYVVPDPDFGHCVYVSPKGAPSCLVGHVLHKIGVGIEDLSSADQNATPIDEILHRAGFEADGITVDLLTKAQSYQDDQIPWGEAVEQARHDVNCFREIGAGA